MRHGYIFFATLTFLLTSFSSDRPTAGDLQAILPAISLDIIKDNASKSTKSYSNPIQSEPCVFSAPDTSVFDIVLNDSKSAMRRLGTEIILERERGDLPFAQYLTRDKKQTLTLFFHPGGTLNEFTEMQVSFEEAKSAKSLEATDFITNSGIKLGISKSEVIAILGKCFEATKDSDVIRTLIYRINDFKNSSFLKRFNYPSYFAAYKFKNDTLVNFRFGFEYP